MGRRMPRKVKQRRIAVKVKKPVIVNTTNLMQSVFTELLKYWQQCILLIMHSLCSLLTCVLWRLDATPVHYAIIYP